MATFEQTATKISVIRRLVKPGCSINTTEESCSPALHQAVEAGSSTLTKLLLWKGVDVNATDCCKRTALHLACQSRHKNNQSIVDSLLSQGAEVDAQNEWGETPLHVACWSKNKNLVSLLLKNGARSDVVNNKDMTPLHVVARLKSNNKSLVDALLDRGASVNAVNSEGWSALHFACFFERTETVLAILKKGGDVNLPDSQGNTPLHVVSTKNAKELIYILLYEGAEVNARNHVGKTPLHLACSFFLTKVIDVLVGNGAEVNSRDSSGNTPLYLAIAEESKYFSDNVSARVDTVENLLIKGARVDVKNVHLKTPFDELVRYVQQFCSREKRTSFDIHEVKRLKDEVVNHIIKLKTAGLQVEVDVSTQLDCYSAFTNNCSEELETIKSTTVVKDLSLYQVFSQSDTEIFHSQDDFLAFNEYLKTPNLMRRFPLYGNLMRSTFRRSKLLTQPVLLSDEEAYVEEASLTISSESEEDEMEQIENMTFHKSTQLEQSAQPCYMEDDVEEDGWILLMNNDQVELIASGKEDEREQRENITFQQSTKLTQRFQPLYGEADAKEDYEFDIWTLLGKTDWEKIVEVEEEDEIEQRENITFQQSTHLIQSFQTCHKEANVDEDFEFDDCTPPSNNDREKLIASEEVDDI